MINDCFANFFSVGAGLHLLLKINFVFLSMGKIKSAKTNYAIPGEAMGQQEFEQMIKKAENGPFHTLKSVKTELAKWKAKHSR